MALVNMLDFEIGLTYGGMVNVETLADAYPLEERLMPPRATPVMASNPIELASGHVRAAGWLRCTWSWDFLTQNQYDVLRVFCTNKSGDVFIKTRDEDGDFTEYTAIMVWPENPIREFGAYSDMTFEFRALEVYT